MRSRISGRRLLPAALAAATVTALGVPASAQEAPPPAPKTHTEDDCVEALYILTYLGLLPDRSDVGRVLCSTKAAKQQEQNVLVRDVEDQDDYTDQINSQYTAETGKPVEQSLLLGLPVRWPKSLTVHVPTVNERSYTFSSKPS